MKRSNYISWDTYFMGVAYLSSLRSKDDSSQVGACIVNQKNRIVGIGYNGLPIGCDDDDFPWEREGDFLNTKYPYVVHAEPNAILNSTVPLDNSKIYVTLFPCNECAKLLPLQYQHIPADEGVVHLDHPGRAGLQRGLAAVEVRS